MVGTLQATVETALIVVGCLFLTVGTIGLIRFPNVYNRMHATSKPTTLGTAAIFTAGFVRFGPAGAGLTSLLGILFLFLTVPTGAHLMARSARRMGVPFLGSVTWPEPPARPAVVRIDDESDAWPDGGDGEGPLGPASKAEDGTDDRDGFLDHRDGFTGDRDGTTDDARGAD